MYIHASSCRQRIVFSSMTAFALWIRLAQSLRLVIEFRLGSKRRICIAWIHVRVTLRAGNSEAYAVVAPSFGNVCKTAVRQCCRIMTTLQLDSTSTWSDDRDLLIKRFETARGVSRLQKHKDEH